MDAEVEGMVRELFSEMAENEAILRSIKDCYQSMAVFEDLGPSSGFSPALLTALRDAFAETRNAIHSMESAMATLASVVSDDERVLTSRLMHLGL